MAVSPKLVPTVGTGIALTPQVQLTIELTQKTNLELGEVLKQELTENPALEENTGPDPDAPEVIENPKDASGRSQDDQDDWGPDDYEKFREYLNASGSVRGLSEFGPERPIDNMLVNQETLASYLTSQIGERLDDGTVVQVCVAIIGNLTDAGYLDATVQEIQKLGNGDWSVAEVEAGLRYVQTLDPSGVGARDVKECLLLQVRGDTRHSKLAENLIRNHYDSCEVNQVSRLASELAVAEDDVRAAIELIGGLDKEPGLTWVPHEPEYLIPDVKVIEDDEGYRVELVEQGMPRVVVNQDFMPVSKNAADEKYRKENLASAKNLLKAIDQRKQTIMKVATRIMDYQEEFLDKGPLGMRPLTLRVIADDLDVHESTVSRAVANKAIDTPQGLLPMKVFFPTKIPCRNDKNVSSLVVKLRIRDIVQNETPEKPLGDSKIHRILVEEGYLLARRTVAKYREVLGFKSASQRKVVGL